MTTLQTKELVLFVTLVGLAAIPTAAASLLVDQLAGATADVMTEEVAGEQEASNTTNASTIINNNNNNNSNVVLGSMFLIGKDKLTSFNRINETYTELCG